MVEVTEKMIEALKAAKEVADVAAGLTSCRSDDEFVWAAQAKIDAALEAALASPAEPVAYRFRLDKDGYWAYGHYIRDDAYVCEPLYAHPPQQEPARLREARELSEQLAKEIHKAWNHETIVRRHHVTLANDLRATLSQKKEG